MMSARETALKEYKALEKAFHAGDADSIAELYTEDAEMFVPGLPVIEGSTAIRETWRMILGAGGNTVTVDVREVDESGDLAYDTGIFTATAPDGSLLNTGKWMVIWKRQSSGTWKIHRDFMHWDIPPATP